MAPHFKKLTDCPENLRESIDWLIQIRYGNGKDGQGLGELAKALKTLIEEAIEKAYVTNFDVLLKLLDSAKSYKCCKEKVTEIEKLKEAKKSTNESLKTILERLNNLNGCFKNHLDSSQQKAYDDTTSKLEQLCKLQESLAGLTDETRCKTLLTNLCDGLETFLGFDKESKGHTGTGIVYSDLDRLCDAVMAFLHGVLKDVSEKQPYKVGKDILIKLVDTQIKPKLCSGHEGLKGLIRDVAGRVSSYNVKSRDSNNKVIEPIGDMIKYVKEGSGKLASGIKNLRVESVSGDPGKEDEQVIKADKLMRGCKGYATKFNTQLDILFNSRGIRDAIDDLNFILSQRVKNALKAVKQESERLEKSSTKEQEHLESMKALIKKTLDDLKESVNNKISVDVTELVGKLKYLVQKILELLKRMKEKLIEYVSDLVQWIQKADGTLGQALQKVDEILSHITSSSTIYPMKIRSTIEQMQMETHSLYQAGELARERVVEFVTEAKKQVTKLDDALKGDLNGLKHEIKKKLNAFKSGLSGIYGLENNVQAGLWTLRGEIEDTIKANVEGIVGNIKLEVESIKGAGGLHGFVDHVRAYAMKFTKDTFKKMVQMWLDDMLPKKPISDNLALYAGNQGQYFSDKSLQRRGYAGIVSTVSEQIMIELGGDITTAGDFVKDVNQKGIAVNVNAVKMACEQFASALEIKFKVPGIDGVSGLIVKKVEVALGVDTSQPSNLGYKPGELTEALNAALLALHYTAKQAAAELKSVAGVTNSKSEIGKVDTALGVADTLYKNLDTAHRSDKMNNFIGQLDDKIVGALHTEIGADPNGINLDKSGLMSAFKIAHEELLGAVKKEKLTAEIETQLPSDDRKVAVVDSAGATSLINAIGLQKAPGFKNYKDYIQPDIFSSTNPSGKLPAAITSIQTQVTDALGQIGQLQAALLEKASYVNINLSLLCTAVEAAAGKDPTSQKDSVKANLLNLKDKIGINTKKELDEIRENLSNLETVQLAQIITETQRFIDEAPLMGQQTIEGLKKHVDSQVYTAASTLTKKARTHYVSNIKLLLEQFAEKIKTELEELPKEIDDDLKKGYKGLMKIFADTFVKEVRGIETIDASTGKSDPPRNSPLSQVANKLKKGFEEFLRDVFGHYDAIMYEGDTSQVSTSLDLLLRQIISSGHFDNAFAVHIEELAKAFDGINMVTMNDAQRILLRPLKCGLQDFACELQKSYINIYEGANPIYEWVTEVTGEKDILPADFADSPKTKLTEEGYNGVRVCLTTFSILYSNLNKLRRKCNADPPGWKYLSINKSTRLGRFFVEQGYNVATKSDSQDGHLQNTNAMKGENILAILENNGLVRRPSADDDSVHDGTVVELYTYLIHFWKASHLRNIDSPKPPCNIYQMLHWLSGLWYNPMLVKLESYLKELFDKPKSKKDVPYSNISHTELSLSGTSTITPQILYDEIAKVCRHAEITLISFFGYGHAGGHYACEVNTNPDGLIYPSDMIKLLCTFFDTLKRVHHQLSFLYKQCNYDYNVSGWRNCYYGQGVGGSDWQCNILKCGNCTAANICKNHPACGLKSPLQSFLEDGLHGFLPHNVTYKDNSLSCSTCPTSPGMPCKTPMGFTEIATVASHRHTGEYIKEVLFDFCGDSAKPLGKLCSLLNCLLPSAPKTLGELFGFYYKFLNGWNDDNEKDNIVHRKTAFIDAVIKANFERSDTTLDVTSMFKSSHHGTSDNVPHLKGDLHSLVKCKYGSTSTAAHPCGPYLRPLCNNICGTFSEKNAHRYLSWIVYLTETFYQQLKELYTKCSENCASTGSKCLISKCHNKCKANDTPMSPTSQHNKSCDSIVRCKFTRPCLFKFGFALEDISSLAGQTTKRTCEDFCMALKAIIDGKCILGKLVYETIPNFLFTIREPFIWTVVALWSLSLLYLFYVLIGRLDTLHIRSHLRSLSSHRVAAQSLLAAARVGKLAKISYLQA